MASQNKFLIKKGMIISAGFLTVIGIIFNSVAMGTNSWIVSEGTRINNTGSPTSSSLWVNYGLFNGDKRLRSSFGDTYYNLVVFCPKGEGVCLVSCGRNETEQKAEFDALRFGTSLSPCIPKTGSSIKGLHVSPTLRFRNSDRANAVNSDDQFMDYNLWITTIIFLSFMLAAQVVSVGLCALNTATIPIETFVGPMGIYVANFIAGLVGLITLSLWGGLYSNNLSSELAVRETIRDEYNMDNTSLGFSYWFVFIALILAIASSVCIRFRNVLKKFDNKDRNENSSVPGGLIY